jgi:hypothetical protein
MQVAGDRVVVMVTQVTALPDFVFLVGWKSGDVSLESVRSSHAIDELTSIPGSHGPGSYICLLVCSPQHYINRPCQFTDWYPGGTPHPRWRYLFLGKGRAALSTLSARCHPTTSCVIPANASPTFDVLLTLTIPPISTFPRCLFSWTDSGSSSQRRRHDVQLARNAARLPLFGGG